MPEPVLKEKAKSLFVHLQESICSALEEVEPSATFRSDVWERTDPTSGDKGGGGLSRVLSGGSVFEQAGVNFSAVHGVLPVAMREKLELDASAAPEFFATGVSLVIHPRSPRVPTTHANFRYFELDNIAWFGGGADLTPYVLEEEDCLHFHKTLKDACDRLSPEYYPRFKEECDRYFHIPHRGETRGIGGIFYDYLGKTEPDRLAHYFDFSEAVGNSFVESYLPIVRQRMNESWTERQKEFQLLRRGRYVEFNLVYDRGTQFGLATGGRTESILMSLPPEVRWQYSQELAETEEERKLISILRNPKQWIS